MITIALDEQGDFENLENKLCTEPVFIGGIIYDDGGDPDDYQTEKVRLQRYLKAICEDAGGTYPKDLHYCSEGGSNNGYRVKQVKTLIGKTLKKFLENGTWKGSDHGLNLRKGSYRIFASLRGENGKTDYLAENVSEAVREGFASNLYVHMAEDVVERLLFYNPVIEEVDHARLELATRRVILEGDARAARMKEYSKLGFSPEKRPPEQTRPGVTEYILTNPANYRTAVERAMINSGKNSLMIDRIAVKSIFYKHATEGMDFLYLADAICAHLSFHRSGSKPSEWIESFSEIAKEINGNTRNLIWGYDDADEYFEKSWKAIERGDYFEALSQEYGGEKCASHMKDFYCAQWYPLLVEKIIKTVNVSDFSTAVRKYKDAVMGNNIIQDKLVHIYEALVKIGESVKFSNRYDEAMLYDLYDAGVSAYTHVGDSENAQRCFEKTQQYAEFVATEVFLRTRNRMAVYLCDRLEFKKALEIADENVNYHELLLNMKRQIFKDEEHESLNHAIALSQRAQIYAFMKDDRAEADFINALSMMEAETPDRLITLSYLLHYYISVGNRKKYEEYAREYFDGRGGLADQFEYLAREGASEHARFSFKFAFYVFIKAVYEFYSDSLSNKLLNRFKKIESTLQELNENTAKLMNGHPWEIIYKYLALIMYENQDQENGDRYVEKIKAISESSGGTIREIANENLRICEASRNRQTIVEALTFTYMYS